MLADGICAREKPVGKCLIDDCDSRAVGNFIAEVAAGEARRSQRIEVAGRGHVEVGMRERGIFAGMARNGKSIAAIASGEKRNIGCHRRVNAGQRRDTTPNVRRGIG